MAISKKLLQQLREMQKEALNETLNEEDLHVANVRVLGDRLASLDNSSK